jgi:hypothetical protein
MPTARARGFDAIVFFVEEPANQWNGPEERKEGSAHHLVLDALRPGLEVENRGPAREPDGILEDRILRAEAAKHGVAESGALKSIQPGAKLHHTPWIGHRQSL